MPGVADADPEPHRSQGCFSHDAENSILPENGRPPVVPYTSGLVCSCKEQALAERSWQLCNLVQKGGLDDAVTISAVLSGYRGSEVVRATQGKPERIRDEFSEIGCARKCHYKGVAAVYREELCDVQRCVGSAVFERPRQEIARVGTNHEV